VGNDGGFFRERDFAMVAIEQPSEEPIPRLRTPVAKLDLDEVVSAPRVLPRAYANAGCRRNELWRSLNVELPIQLPARRVGDDRIG